METADWHVYQVLTKRSSRRRNFVNARYPDRPPPPHIWLGTSIENARTLGRLRHLKRTNASIRFLSLEPLLGPLGALDLSGILWVIAGRESEPRTDRGVLLQAMGGSQPEVRRQRARWSPMARVPEHCRSRLTGRITRASRPEPSGSTGCGNMTVIEYRPEICWRRRPMLSTTRLTASGTWAPASRCNSGMHGRRTFGPTRWRVAAVDSSPGECSPSRPVGLHHRATSSTFPTNVTGGAVHDWRTLTWASVHSLLKFDVSVSIRLPYRCSAPV